MRTHDQVVKKLMKRPGVRAEVERLDGEESAQLDAPLKARQEAGLTQAQVAERMGTLAPAAVELGVLPEGARATVLIPEGNETFAASPEEKAMLVAALAAADRGETVPVSEVLELLRKR